MNTKRPASLPDSQHRPGGPSLGPGVPSIFNLPNLLSGIRFLGSFLIVALALSSGGDWLLPTTLVLILTDWFDGRIAVRWHQRTAFGARLDSLADVTFYSAVLLALAWLHTDVVWAEKWWIVPGAVVYALNGLVGQVKFGRFPSYHTRGAKLAWVASLLVILGVLVAGQGWPIRVAGVWVLLVNLEALLITCVLPSAHVDVPGLAAALRIRRDELRLKQPGSEAAAD